MDSKKWYKKLRKHVLEAMKDNMFLPKEGEERGYGWDRANKKATKIIAGEVDYVLLSSPFNYLQAYHITYCYYHALYQEECFQGQCAKAQTEFALSAAYGYLDQAISYDFRKRGENTSESLDSVTFTLHQLIQAGWWKEAKQIFDWIMADIQTKDLEKMVFVDPDDLIITQMAWFILRISAKVFGYKLDDSYYPHLQEEEPSEWKIYSEVIDHWDTQDLTEVDKYCYQLSDIHILNGAMAESNTTAAYSGAEIYVNGNYLYPFALLTWLKLREYKGLKNPNKFNHELLQNPLAILFKDPLEKPQNLPFVKELTEFLLTKEPQFPLPDSFIK